jgi:hypothetical protein
MVGGVGEEGDAVGNVSRPKRKRRHRTKQNDMILGERERERRPLLTRSEAPGCRSPCGTNPSTPEAICRPNEPLPALPLLSLPTWTARIEV